MQLCRQGLTTLWVTQNPQARRGPIVSFLSSPTYGLSKVPGIPAETCGGPLPSPFEEFATLYAVHQVATPRGCGGAGVLWCSVIVQARVSNDLALQVSQMQLECDPSLPHRTGLSIDNICSLLNLGLEATYLMFEGRIYQQVHGTATGSPVSVVVANLVMEKIKCKALSSFHILPASGGGMWMTHALFSHGTWWSPSCAPQQYRPKHPVNCWERESLKSNCHFWISSWPGRTMAASVHQCFVKPQTQTSTWPMIPITQQPIRRQPSGHWCAGQRHFPPQVSSPTASLTEWGADSEAISDYPLHPWPVIINS